jgi:hypothetical protein
MGYLYSRDGLTKSMTIASLLALCASIAYISIGIYAARERYKSISSIIFLFFSLVLGLWALAYFELSFSPNGLYRLLWFCLAAAGWTLLPALLLHYSLSLKDDLRSGDRSFMNDLPRMEEDASIVTAVIAMAKSLNLDTIAEGVETEEQMNFLKNCHCDKMQGFLFSHPLPAKEVEKLFLQ